jgi:hypothetical protein
MNNPEETLFSTTLPNTPLISPVIPTNIYVNTPTPTNPIHHPSFFPITILTILSSSTEVAETSIRSVNCDNAEEKDEP